LNTINERLVFRVCAFMMFEPPSGNSIGVPSPGTRTRV
jgi:hypothetical protein